MKRIFAVGLLSPAVLFLVFGTAAAAYAQKEQEKEAKPEKAPQQEKQQAKPAQPKPERAQQQPKQQAKPAQAKPERAQQQPKQQAKPAQPKPERAQKQQAKPAQQQQQARNAPPQRTKQVARGWQQQRGWLKQGGGWKGNNSWQQDRATQWQSQHRTWAQRGGYGGYYIPEATFALSFGDQHWFRISSQPTIVGGYPRFQQGGFWFMMVDPWPESWSPDWYANDDVYVGYNNGYYLYNRTDPGDAIAISIVL
jgi:hypothetical protein